MSAAPPLTVETAADLVRLHLPPGLPRALEPVGEGDFCFAYRAGDRIVRVAKHAEAAAAIRREACVLARIADRLPLEVPRPEYHEPPGGPPFTVHRTVGGHVLTSAAWEALPPGPRAHLVQHVADFLRQLHGLAEEGIACDLPRLDEAAFAAALRHDVPMEMAGRLAPDVLRRLDAALEATAARGPESPLALLHRDLAPGHLLCDEARGALTGVIDFGDVAIGPPARDFIFLYEDFGVSLCDEVARAYAGPDAAALMEDVRAWYLLEALSWTLERLRLGSDAEAAHGLREITRELGG